MWTSSRWWSASYPALGIGQTEPVLVILDPAIPAGPWDARIVLHSGMTEREATAQITFPPSPASSSGRVETRTRAGGGSRALPLLVAAAVPIGVSSVLIFRFIRRP